MNAYSISRIENYRRCPAWFKFQYLDKILIPESLVLIFGSIIHDIIHRYSEACIANNKERDEDIMKAILSQKTVLMPDTVFSEISDLAERYVHTHIIMPGMLEKKYAFDHAWNLCDWFDKDARFRAVVDRLQIDGNIAQITDYKSDRYFPPKSVIEKSLQMKVYAFIISHLYPEIETIILDLDYIRFGFGGHHEIIIDAKKNAEETRKELETIMFSIDQDQRFTARPGTACDWCPYPMVCDAFQELFKVGIIQHIATEGDAEIMARKLAVLDAEKKALTEALKAYCEHRQQGIWVDDNLLDNHPTEGMEFPDTRKIAGILKENGIGIDTIYQHLRFTSTSVENILKTLGRTKADMAVRKQIWTTVEAEGRPTAGNRFYFKKVRD
jgi:RecB family exonuclease